MNDEEIKVMEEKEVAKILENTVYFKKAIARAREETLKDFKEKFMLWKETLRTDDKHKIEYNGDFYIIYMFCMTDILRLMKSLSNQSPQKTCSDTPSHQQDCYRTNPEEAKVSKENEVTNADILPKGEKP